MGAMGMVRVECRLLNHESLDLEFDRGLSMLFNA